ncbi:hypothetical protein ACFL5G_04685 [Candidatus Margulisiibacteriota bacterium]
MHKKILNFKTTPIDQLDFNYRHNTGDSFIAMNISELANTYLASTIQEKGLDMKASFFILALANLHYDGKLLSLKNTETGDVLEKIFTKNVKLALQKKAPERSEDEGVIIAISKKYKSIWNVPAIERKMVGNFFVEFNPLRALRPSRMSSKKVARNNDYTPILQPFAKDDFNFAKSFIDAEVFLEIKKPNISLAFNKYPYAKSHALCIIDRKKGEHPQLLTPYILEQVDYIQKLYPKAVLAWNSKGAHASVNHAHIHLIASNEDLPIMKLPIEKKVENEAKGGIVDWPINNRVFEGKDRFSNLKKYIYRNIHTEEGMFINKPVYYNLIFAGKKIFLFMIRDQQEFGMDVDKVIGTGIAWLEEGGKITTIDKDQYESVTAKDIETNMRAESVSDFFYH